MADAGGFDPIPGEPLRLRVPDSHDELLPLLDLTPDQQKVLQALNATHHHHLCSEKGAAELARRTRERFSTQQWLDENEREWLDLDAMCRSRPWASKRDEVFPYPFRKAVIQMQEAGERNWACDPPDMDLRQLEWTSTQEPLPCDVLVHLRHAPEYPPDHRVLLFMPEFGDPDCVSKNAWERCFPSGQVDVWLVCWQGWSQFDLMIDEVLRKVISFADGVSTVWYGHSAGSIVAYEVLKAMERRQSPNFPVALIVAGCPAPHIFQDSQPHSKLLWMEDIHYHADMERLGGQRLHELSKEFAFGAQKQLSRAQVRSLIAEKQTLESYRFRHDVKHAGPPILAFASHGDTLVEDTDVSAWAQYTKEEFLLVTLNDYEDNTLLENLGHRFGVLPPITILDMLATWACRFGFVKVQAASRHSYGSTDGDLPSDIGHLIVGAGVTGVLLGRSLAEHDIHDYIIIDRLSEVGGVWHSYGNKYSRVNTSEVGYRLVDKHGPNTRVNTDHSPMHDIVHDISQVAAQWSNGKFRFPWTMRTVTKQTDGKWLASLENMRDGSVHERLVTSVHLCVNRRIGRRRDVSYRHEDQFRGSIAYGYANEMSDLDFWGKRVLIVGAGAFAFENLRTAIEHGARHAIVLGRRAGATCPKWIDMIAFLRPMDKHFLTNPVGNVISFEYWKQCYSDAGIPTPDCWAEGLLKPHNHTVSVSDLAFIAAFHGLAELLVGEISHFTPDGQGVMLKDGRRIDCDTVIKATGFHLNDEVPKMTGCSKMYSNGFLEFNLTYPAEPLLDGGQFGSARGHIDSSALDAAPESVELLLRHGHELPAHIVDLFTPRGNPFGSGYTGPTMALCNHIAWLTKHQDIQRNLLEQMGPPRLDCTLFWASFGGKAAYQTLIDMAARMFQKTEVALQLDDS